MNRILSLDPGSSKVGVCILDSADRNVLLAEIVPRDKLADGFLVFLDRFAVDTILLGDGTHHKQILQVIENVLSSRYPEAQERPPVLIVGERNTTLQARDLYRKEHPPKFPWNLLPIGLVPVSVPLDHYAARAIALNWLDDMAAGRIRRRSELALD